MSTRYRRLLVGTAATALLSFAGSWMFLSTPAVVTLAPVAGVCAALCCRRTVDSALAAAGGCLLGIGLSWAVPFAPWGSPQTVPLEMAAAAAAAAAFGAGAAWLMRTAPRTVRPLVYAALAITVAACWHSALTMATRPLPDGGSPAAILSQVPTIEPSTGDEELFLNVVDSLRKGQPYYPTFARALVEGGRADQVLGSPVAIRQPIFFYGLALLPRGGIWIVVAALCLATAAVVSAFILAKQYLRVPFALIAAVLVASYCATIAFLPGIIDAEPWTGMLGLVSLALLAVSRSSDTHRRGWAWAAAGVALAGTALRELGVAFVIIGLIASALDSRDRAQRSWLPWASALLAAAVGFIAHVAAARQGVLALGNIASALPPSGFTWWHPDGLGTLSAVIRMAGFLDVALPVAVIVAVAAVVGAAMAPHDRCMRFALTAVTGGGWLALVVLRPPGAAESGLPPSYWIDVVLPSVLACAPLALVLVPGARVSTPGLYVVEPSPRLTPMRAP
jgi:hypothetical protein